jgi:hypothetical protein
VGLFARATRDRGCVSVLLANFVATGAPAHTVAIDLHGRLPFCRGPRVTTLATLDTSSTSLANSTVLHVGRQQSVTVSMPSQSVALVRSSCTEPH